MYTPNFIVSGKKFVLSLHYNGNNSYLFVKFKAKDSETVPNPLCLAGISTDFRSLNVTELY